MNKKKQLLELASCCLWILALGLSAGISLFVMLSLVLLAF